MSENSIYQIKFISNGFIDLAQICHGKEPA